MSPLSTCSSAFRSVQSSRWLSARRGGRERPSPAVPFTGRRAPRPLLGPPGPRPSPDPGFSRSHQAKRSAGSFGQGDCRPRPSPGGISALRLRIPAAQRLLKGPGRSLSGRGTGGGRQSRGIGGWRVREAAGRGAPPARPGASAVVWGGHQGPKPLKAREGWEAPGCSPARGRRGAARRGFGSTGEGGTKKGPLSGEEAPPGRVRAQGAAGRLRARPRCPESPGHRRGSRTSPALPPARLGEGAPFQAGSGRWKRLARAAGGRFVRSSSGSGFPASAGGSAGAAASSPCSLFFEAAF